MRKKQVKPLVLVIINNCIVSLLASSVARRCFKTQVAESSIGAVRMSWSTASSAITSDEETAELVPCFFRVWIKDERQDEDRN